MINSFVDVNLQVGKLVRGVTVGHVEKPGLVWVSAPPTEQSDQLLKEVPLATFSTTPNVACTGGDDES